MLDTVRGYAAITAGLAEAGARAVWESLTSAPDDDTTASAPPGLPRQVQDTVDVVLSSSRQNSELLVGLVRTEVERAVGRLGFVREEELAAVRRHVQRLETQLARLTGRTPDPSGGVADGDEDLQRPDLQRPDPTPPATEPARKAAKKTTTRPTAKKTTTRPRPTRAAAAAGDGPTTTTEGTTT